MDTESLEQRLEREYGKEVAGKLYSAMLKIHKIDFCVAIGWTANEVSISRSCTKAGRIFKLSDDYKSLVLPDGRVEAIENLHYVDISTYLPRGDGEQQNCICDR